MLIKSLNQKIVNLFIFYKFVCFFILYIYITFFIFEKSLYSMHKNLHDIDKCNDSTRTWDHEHRCWKVIVYHHWVWVRTVCRMVTIRYTLVGWMSSTSWDARVREVLCLCFVTWQSYHLNILFPIISNIQAQHTSNESRNVSSNLINKKIN